MAGPAHDPAHDPAGDLAHDPVHQADLDTQKSRLRAQARAARAAADSVTRASDAPRWTAQVLRVADIGAGIVIGPGTVVAAYVSYGTEPPTGHLVAELAGLGAEVLLPVLRDDRDLDWESDGARLGREAIARADLVVAPALLVALDGTRLGQGGGSYDRALTRVRPGTPVVALVHDEEVLDAGSLPRGPHDLPVTHAATPGGLIALTESGTPGPQEGPGGHGTLG